ncbi:sugar transferase [Sphingobium sp. B2]|uniref:sugar transferase n=1 Tax=Sphingobium sp. B2 TaxID=2583228 RepID=UPI0021BD28CF|nr:sugar transferase [Sphingobium sp. B2]
MTVYLLQMLFDLAALIVGFGIAGLIRHGMLVFDATALQSLLPIFLVISSYAGAYSYEGVVSREGIHRVLTALAIAFAFYALVRFAIKEAPTLSRTYIFAGIGVAAVLLVVQRLLLIRFIRFRLGARFMKLLLVIDDQPIPVPDGFDVIDIADYGVTPDVNDPRVLDQISNLLLGADRVVVSSAVERRESWSLYLKGIGCNGELLVPELHSIGQLHASDGSSLVGIPVSTGPLDIRSRILKRAFDLCLTVPAIIALTPLLLIIAFAVKVSSPGPILFRQVRMGRGNRLFHVYKFRSMRTEATDDAGSRSASRDDNRITAVGRFIRKTSMDELPQLFNVLEGDMSLVGPRPHALGSLAGDELFWRIDQRYWQRHAIKPGITGLAQVRGFRGATDHRNDLMQRLQADLEYVSNWSLVGDVTILLRTFLVVVHKNAY